MRKSGFTLLELILVIAIIVVLAGAMLPVFNITRQEAKEAKAKADLDSIKTAAMMFKGDTNTWPPVGNVGTGLINNTPTATPGWDGPYLTEWAKDPGNVSYALTACGTGNLSMCANSTGTGSTISVLVTSNMTNP
jgi:type II secretion system protein G